MTALAIDPSEIKLTDYRAIRDRLMNGGVIPKAVLDMLTRRETAVSVKEKALTLREVEQKSEDASLVVREQLLAAARLELAEREAILANRESAVALAMAKVEKAEAQLGRKLLKDDLLPAANLPPAQRFRFKDIAAAVLTRHGVARSELIARGRSQKVVNARRAICALAREFTLLSLPEIGRLLGDRDHTTVMHHVKMAEPMMFGLRHSLGPSAALAQWVDALFHEING